MSFKIPSQLSENQVEADVSSYLGFITPIWSRRFRLISVDESTTGADKLFNRFLPIYLQFKVSNGLNPTAFILSRFRNMPLTNIIEYRRNNNLSGNPVLYFELRRKAKTATDFQHNILRSLNTPPSQFSLYIAPLTLELLEYEEQLHESWYFRFYPFDPFSSQELHIHDASFQRNILIGANPFLRHHVSIPPHRTVTTHKHHYSYSQSGGDVAWHGGEILNEDFRLSNQFAKILSEFYSNPGSGTNLEQYLRFIQDFRLSNYLPNYGSAPPNDSFYQIQAFARILKTEYNIKLLLLTEAKSDGYLP